jgi:hypothetical protein
MRLAPLLLLAAAACGPLADGRGTASGEVVREGFATTMLHPRAEQCIVLEVDTAGAPSTLRCAGAGRWELLLVTDAEGRATLAVVDPEGAEHPLDAERVVGHERASRFAERVDWRITGARRAPPTALIVTHVAIRPDGARNSAGERLELLVVRIGEEVCVTDRVTAVEGAREEARRLAETAAERPCL